MIAKMRSGIFISVMALLSVVQVAHALDPKLEVALEAGLIGERSDGYLGFVDEARGDDDLKRRVAQLNAQRREVYTRKSVETGESLSTIAAMIAERQIARSPSGQYYMDKYGVWHLK